jgi:hypothetical protein
MYLDIGEGRIIPLKDIVVIMDMDNATTTKNTRNFLNNAEKNGSVVYSPNVLPCSFVVTRNGQIYFSAIGAGTLHKKTEFRVNYRK